MANASSDHPALGLDEWIQKYYLTPRPDETARILAGLRSTNCLDAPEDPQGDLQNINWPLLGFLAELFARHPERLAEWLHDWPLYAPGQQKFLLMAVSLSATSEAKRFIQTVWSDRLHQMIGYDLAATPPPDRTTLAVMDAFVLDLYWSQFFFTGDVEPVRTIIDCLPLLYERPEIPDGKVDAGPMLIGAAAEWSLTAIARDHARVLEICRAERRTRSGAARQLLEAIVRKVEGGGPHSQVSGEETTTEVLRELSLERRFLNGIIGGYPPKIENEGEARTIRERWDRAIRLAREFVQSDPTAPGSRILLADLLRMGHNIDVPGAAEECCRILTELLALDPDDAEAHYTLASLYVATDPEKAPLAERHFREAERCAGPNVCPDAYQGLGLACLYQKKIAEAISYFEKCIQLIGDAPQIRELVSQLRSGNEVQVVFKQREGLKTTRRWWQFWK